MLIGGSKGHAIEVLQILEENNISPIYLFDDINEVEDNKLFNAYTILTKIHEANDLFKTAPDFVLGLGDPHNRRTVFNKLTAISGKPVSTIANSSRIGRYVNLGDGLNVMHYTLIGNNIKIGTGCLLNAHSSVHHDVVMGEFCEIAPGARILGGACIGNFTFVGTNSVILPKIKIGSNVIIGAGAVITKDVPDNVTVVGVPGRITPQNH